MSGCACGGKKVMIFSCSGAADVGELSDRVARKLAKDGKGSLFCAAVVGAKIPGKMDAPKNADELITIDGCGVLCAKKILENAGFTPKSYNLEALGFTKGKTEVNSTAIDKAAASMSL